jgi:Bacterial toxin 33
LGFILQPNLPLDKAGENPEKIKQEIVGKKNSGRYDLYKDKQGNIYIKPKGGQGTGEPTGLNINNF